MEFRFKTYYPSIEVGDFIKLKDGTVYLLTNDSAGLCYLIRMNDGYVMDRKFTMITTVKEYLSSYDYRVIRNDKIQLIEI